MERPLKLLIAVLGIAGTLAFLAPTSLPAPNAPLESSPSTEVAPTIVPPVEPSSDVQIEAVVDPGPQEPFKFGEPTIDGKPYGEIAGDNSNQSAPPPNTQVTQVAPPQNDVPVNAPEASPSENAALIN